MTKSPSTKPAASKSVFINCPFDDGFRPILRAMVFTIISSGYHPCCALDATDGAEVRIGKIATMIGACDPDQAIGCVRDWLSEHRPSHAPPLPGAAAMQDDYRLFQAEVGALIKPYRLDPDHLTHSDYLFAVRDWIAVRADPA